MRTSDRKARQLQQAAREPIHLLRQYLQMPGIALTWDTLDQLLAQLETAVTQAVDTAYRTPINPRRIKPSHPPDA